MKIFLTLAMPDIANLKIFPRSWLDFVFLMGKYENRNFDKPFYFAVHTELLLLSLVDLSRPNKLFFKGHLVIYHACSTSLIFNRF